MKKYLPHIDLITLSASAVGIMLRFWLLAVGVDEKGLYPANHISWILLIILTVALAVALFLLAGVAGKNRFYTPNFPASLTGAVGYAAGAVGMFVAALHNLRITSLSLYRIAGIVGILAAAALLLGGWCRYKGKKPHFVVFMLPCAYLGLRLFCLGHTWGDEPELCRFILAFLAVAACVLATYQLWAFSVDLGKRSVSLLGSLLATYLCLVSVPGNADSIFYLTMAIWLFTNLCPKLPPVHRPAPAAPVETETPVVPVVEETPAAPAEEVPAAPKSVESAVPQQLYDPEIDAIIAEILAQTQQEKE